MNWLDIVITVVLVFAVIGGLRSGLIRAVLSLAGLIFGVVLAGQFYQPFGDLLSAVLQGGIARILAFIIILVAVIALATVLAIILTKAVSAATLGWLNRIGGGAFGLIMGGIFCAAILAIWVKFLGINSAITESTIAPVLLARFPVVLSLLPKDFDSIRQFFGNIKSY